MAPDARPVRRSAHERLDLRHRVDTAPAVKEAGRTPRNFDLRDLQVHLQLVELATDLQIDAARMRANLDLTGGLIMAESLTMALAPHIGRPEAQRIVRATCDQAVKSGVDLRQAAVADMQMRAVLSPEEIDKALDPGGYLGSTDAFIDRALASYSEVQSSRGVF